MNHKTTKNNTFHSTKIKANGISRMRGNMFIFYGKTEAKEFPSF